ncbi:MAG: hypothetical protein O3A29_15030 [Planctomycetota bacterium]|nr:hypothetical protein [Planctomycetota bacterium]
MTTQTAIDYLQLFNTRREYFRLLLNLSRKQASCIHDEHYHDLVDILSQKQRILGSLDELSKTRHRHIQEWTMAREQLDPKMRAACEDCLAESESLLADLLSEETSSTTHLTTRRDKTRKQLLAVSQGSHVHAAYHNTESPSDSTSIHLDVNQ